jgi:hypothetical protein
MRCELSDYDWTAIKPMLPNKPRGVRRVVVRQPLAVQRLCGCRLVCHAVRVRR